MASFSAERLVVRSLMVSPQMPVPRKKSQNEQPSAYPRMSPNSRLEVWTRRAFLNILQKITHYRWVSQLWSRDDILCRGSKTNPRQTGPEAERGVRSRSSGSSSGTWIFAGFTCPSSRLSSKLHRPIGERRKKSIAESFVRLRQDLRHAAVRSPGICGKPCVQGAIVLSEMAGLTVTRLHRFRTVRFLFGVLL